MAMRARQTSAWFIVDRPVDAAVLSIVRRLPPGTGVLALDGFRMQVLVRLVRARGLSLAEEGRDAVRVHDLSELRRALRRGVRLILLSPLHATSTHEDWQPIPRMRAAAYARLANRRLVALGGMNAVRFRRLERLGFRGWAGISAFRT